ncbi:MAG: DnaB-like helicase C-terminal domain-containing protein [Candidatus Spyradosoma sp.]
MKPRWFSDDAARAAFEEIRNRAAAGAPFFEKLIEDATKKVGTANELTRAKERLGDGLQSSVIRELAGKLKEHALRAEFSSACRFAMNAVADGRDTQSVLAELTANMERICSGTESRAITLEAADRRRVERVIAMSNGTYKNPDAIRVGVPRLNDILGGGLEGKRLYVLGAASGCGKSAFAADIAVQAASDGKEVLCASFEMDDDEILGRVAANCCGVSVPKSCEEWKLKESLAKGNPAIAEALENMKKPLRIAQRLRFISEGERDAFFQQVRLEFRRKRFDLLIVDYLQLIEGEAKDERENVTKITRGLKRLARDLGIPVLALAQFNREGAKSSKPRITDFRESSSVENDADAVLLLSEDIPENKREELAKLPERPMFLEVGKNRNGARGELKLWFKPECSRFRERKEQEGGAA